MTRQCNTCMHWSPYKISRLGRCRKEPPTVIAAYGYAAYDLAPPGMPPHLTVWPETEPDEVCDYWRGEK